MYIIKQKGLSCNPQYYMLDFFWTELLPLLLFYLHMHISVCVVFCAEENIYGFVTIKACSHNG